MCVPGANEQRHVWLVIRPYSKYVYQALYMYFFCFLHVPGANEKRDVWLDVCLGVNSDKISQTSALPM